MILVADKLFYVEFYELSSIIQRYNLPIIPARSISPSECFKTTHTTSLSGVQFTVKCLI